MNQVMPVLFFAWVNSHRAAAARIGDAMYFHVRDLPHFRDTSTTTLAHHRRPAAKVSTETPGQPWTKPGNQSTLSKIIRR